jgi:uncharacterized spore protein YtfJ
VDAAAILEKTHEVLNARQVIGDPYEKNGTMVLPAVSIRGGGGGGGGESVERTPGGVGGGVGLTARPVGAYVIRGDQVSWVPAIDVNRMVLGGQFVAVIALLVARSVVRARTKRRIVSAIAHDMSSAGTMRESMRPRAGTARVVR